LIDIAIKNKTQRFVFISTDKAVNPVNNMGMSKRIVEKHILSLNSSSTKFMIIRFGNVLESSGSAIPIFKKQIESGGPIKLTDKRMERFFMSLTEAGQLVIQASILGEGGELYVLNMGKPYKMIDIIYKLLNIYGYEKADFRIEIIGKKPGEKFTEELFHDYEKPKLSQHERIYVCKTNHNEIEEEYRNRIEKLLNESKDMQKDELIMKLKDLI
ncbi:MAG: polysaccharide biosynthesis protein, partial [Candidatus Heimdallarchaeota archaeon]|nr:polysaccharide biosynthesis protein [Candidatus Heimdallarchaeota archaeon]MCK4877395.1 polysaccharide biosynthesis protein [Candidatus Heimdallarchaeota archaeon]